MAIIAAADGTQAAINTAMASASDGDTVTVPAGTWTWTGSTPLLSITKAITLKGAGIGNTLIGDGCTGQNDRLITITLVANKVTRLSGFTFFRDGTRSANNTAGIINVVGQIAGGVMDDRRIRIDHCFFNLLQGLSLQINCAWGVMDHCNLINSSNMVYCYNATAYVFADDRWSEPAPWGSEEFFFMENNTFERVTQGAGVDAYAGARYVARYNTSTRAHWDAHGTESAQRARGTRAIEIYRNTMIGPFTGNAYVNLRSGTALIHHNTVTNASINVRSAALVNERCGDSYLPWSSADGVNYWDNNGPSNPVAEYVATQGNGDGAGTRKVVVAGAGWAVDEWKGYILRKMVAPYNTSITAVNATDDTLTIPGHGLAVSDIIDITNNVGSTPHLMGRFYVHTVVDADTIKLKTTSGGSVVNITVAGTGGYIVPVSGSMGSRTCSGTIVSNTIDTITFAPAIITPTQDMSFVAGDTFEINLVDEVMDQPGKGASDDLNGVNPPIHIIPWVQATEPVRAWENYTDNPVAGTPSVIGSPTRAEYSLQILDGTHFFNGVAEPGYTEFTYPHPLVTDDESSEEPTVSGNVSRMRLRRIG